MSGVFEDSLKLILADGIRAIAGKLIKMQRSEKSRTKDKEGNNAPYLHSSVFPERCFPGDRNISLARLFVNIITQAVAHVTRPRYAAPLFSLRSSRNNFSATPRARGPRKGLFSSRGNSFPARSMSTTSLGCELSRV